MNWEKPTFEEIDMNAEIGSYQGDYEDEDDGIL
jgi:coenzyme PQQ precursor peptide PqqA